MALRNRIPDELSNYMDPVRGVNLVASPEDLEAGEALKLGNCYFWNGLRKREGSVRITPTAISTVRVVGGHKFYYGSGLSKRLVAYGTNISSVSDTGAAIVLTSSMTAGRETFFTTWSVTDKVYISNGTDKLFEYDGSVFQSVDGLVGAVNVPNGCTKVVPVLDRLFAITSAGRIERTNPRVAHIWSSNSTWATFRPQLGGPFTAMAPHTLRSVNGDLFPGAIACQANAMYMITGTNYGADVTAASPPTGEDGTIKLIDPRVGTSSPRSLVTVPGIGVFGVSSDLNVWHLPFGASSPIIMGDKLRSTGDISGLESANRSQLDKIWMVYHDRKLILGFPTGADNFCSQYFWLDIRALTANPDLGYVWTGPHTGFTTNHVWTEDQNGENSLVAGEGNAVHGTFVYRLLQPGTYTDAVGLTNVPVELDYQTYFKDFGTPSHFKYLRGVRLDTNQFTGDALLGVHDLFGPLVEDVPIISS